MMQGKVIQSTGAWYQVKGQDGALYPCQLRGKMRLTDQKFTNPVAVGDHVRFLPGPPQAPGVIEEVLPRRNYMLRQVNHKKAYGQILAANLDQAVWVGTAQRLSTQWTFIDRFLAIAETLGIAPVLVFNKLDVLEDEDLRALNATQRLYETLGYPTVALSAQKQLHLDRLQQLLHRKVSLLCGQSGVGKSTLINALMPTAQQAVAPLYTTERGRHTTTYPALFEFAPDSFLIDSPGIQTLVPHALELEALALSFPELRRRAPGCRFYNCTHVHEPTCAVRQALAAGEMAPTRYDSYRTMRTELEEKQ